MRQWAKENNALKDDDIFISTNVDEVLNNLQKRFNKVCILKVLSREALHKLRWCKTTHSVLSGALWMPIGRFPTIHFVICFVFQLLNLSKKSNRFDLALRTDRAVVKRPHTWSLPTIYRFAIFSDFFVSHPSTWVIGVLRIQQYIGMQFPELFVSHLVQLGATHMLSQMERY